MLYALKKQEVPFDSISFPHQLQFGEAILLIFCMLCHLHLSSLGDTLVQGVKKSDRYIYAVTDPYTLDSHIGDFHTKVATT